MATATKQSTAAKIRGYLLKRPKEKAADVAFLFNVSPAYVYAIKAKMKTPTPRVPKEAAKKFKWTHVTVIDDKEEEPKVELIEPTPDNVNHPAHYKVGGIETIDFIEAKGLNYHLGNVVKYITRADSKGNREEDLLKARWYLNREIAKFSK